MSLAQEKFLFFAHHMVVMDAIENHLRSKRTVDYIRIDGQTAGEKRHKNVRKFQCDDNCRIAILSITAASLGVTMTAASTVVFAEVHWTPAQMLQAEDRAHRIGQEHSHVNIMYLFGEDTLDEILFKMIQFKNKVVTSTLDGTNSDYKIKQAI